MKRNNKFGKQRTRAFLGLVTVVAVAATSTAIAWFENKLPSLGGGSGSKPTPPSTRTIQEPTKVEIQERPLEIIHKPALSGPVPFPIPTSSEIISTHKGAFVTSYNTRLRNPNWSCVRLARRDADSQNEAETEAEEEGNVSRSKSRFKEDGNIPAQFRTKPEEFLRTGLDRGHLTAAADLANTSQASMDETFLMSNISPQVGVGMNRHFWRLLEAFARSLTFHFDDVIVCSGPLFLPEFHEESKTWRVSYQVIGPKKDIAVPTHFFKCIQATNIAASSPQGGKKEESQACFVVPNRAIDLKTEPLEGFAVSKHEVERLAGFELFPQTSSFSQSPQMLCDQVKCQLAKEVVYSNKRAQ